jgi:hypothetical protein
MFSSTKSKVVFASCLMISGISFGATDEVKEELMPSGRSVISLTVIDPSNPQDVGNLNHTLDRMRAEQDESIWHLAPVIEKMVDWFKAEYGSVCDVSILNDEFYLKLLSEATFFTHSLPLKSVMDGMTYGDIRKFMPIQEIFEKTPFGIELDKAVKKMKIPSQSDEASWALQNVAWVIYLKRVGEKTFKREEAAYNQLHQS